MNRLNLFYIFMFMLISCSVNQPTTLRTHKQTEQTVKTYSELWQKVQKYEKKGLTKSAYQTVEEILKMAQKDKNGPQIVKSLLYEAKYINRLEEESTYKIIQNFKKEIGQNNRPEKNILANYLAQIYWQYYQQNRWKFAHRTSLAKPVDSTDFRTWDLQTLTKTIEKYFDLSLKDSRLLLKIPVKQWREIIDYAPKMSKYQPVLYDILLQESLRYYQNGENRLIQPINTFQIDNPGYFLPADRFSKLPIKTFDSLSPIYKALKYYQKAILLHKEAPLPISALAYIDLARLKFVHDKSILPNKDSLYLKSLDNFIKSYKETDVAAMAYYEKAKMHRLFAKGYNPKAGPAWRWENKKAVEICQKAIQKYPKSVGAISCQNLKNAIEKPALNLKAEKIIPENNPALIKIQFKNMTKPLVVNIFKANQENISHLSRIKTTAEKQKYLQTLSLAKNITIVLPDTKDYQNHSIENYIPPLSNGRYIVAIYPANSAGTALSYQILQVTDIAIMQLNDLQEDKVFMIYNRTNGQALSNIKVKIQRIDYLKKDTISIRRQTDKKGRFKFKIYRNYYQAYQFVINYKNNKKAYFKAYLSPGYHPATPHEFNTAFIFTDRAVYRPGQSLYFKAICLKKKSNSSEVISGKTVKISLLDANGQKINSQKFTTNTYGSIHGAFILPRKKLNGRFTLVLKGPDFYTRKSIEIAEYKRPQFEIVLQKPVKTYHIGDTITIQGRAENYAGTPMANAWVKYNILRQASYPKWAFWRLPHRSTAQEIAVGKTKTDKNGHFSLKFKALPDYPIKPKENPIYTYRIRTAVTDMNGQTQSAQLAIKAAFQNIIAKIDMPAKISKNKNDTIHIKTFNLSDVPVPARLKISIYKLKSPGRILRDRPWPSPYIKNMPYADFTRLFPHIPYTDQENKPIYWAKKKKLYETYLNTGQKTELIVKPDNYWPNGKYLISVTNTDSSEHKLLYQNVFDIIDPTTKTVPDNLLIDWRQNKTMFKPGEILKFEIGSAAKNNSLYVWVEKNHKIIIDKIIKTQGTYNTIKVPITKNDRGGFALHYVYNVFNTSIIKTKLIKVPYKKHRLKIKTLRFKDKLQPGTYENWTFEISGLKNKPAKAEVLANMYDASLDQIKPNNWEFNPIMSVNYQPFLNPKPVSSYGLMGLTLNLMPNFYSNPAYFKPMNLKWFGFHLSSPRIMYAMDALPVKTPGRISFRKAENQIPEHKEKNTKPNEANQSLENQVYYRKNFNETAFFYPDLITDKKGVVKLKFKLPESLTKWKFQLLAHTKNLDYAYHSKTVVAQKDLMVFPNLPRFVRRGDQIMISTKISNMTNRPLSGEALISFINPLNQKDISRQIIEGKQTIPFKINDHGQTMVNWKVKIPQNIDLLQIKIAAKTARYTDAEQRLLPVLSDQILVTDTKALWARGHQKKEFFMRSLVKDKSKTKRNFKLTLEMTANPAWYAVQALPYIDETSDNCSEHIFSRLYANSLGAYIIKKQPKIKEIFDLWKKYDTQSFLSNLEKNQDLKSIIINETPWVKEAEDEKRQKKRIALLFDLNKMANEKEASLKKLAEMQLPNGGFPWFEGSPYPNAYITRHIIAGLGHLKKLGVLDANNNELQKIIKKSLSYLDNNLVAAYRKLLKNASLGKTEKYLKNYHPSVSQIHGLYARSFFPKHKVEPSVQKAINFFQKQANKYWLTYPLYQQALIALTAHRTGINHLAKGILQSIEENSLKSDEMGMYWKENKPGWQWYQSPIETQALLIETFDEIEGYSQKLDEMRIWLLKHKQVNAWPTTKQTTEAVYALLLDQHNWLSTDTNVRINLGPVKIDPSKDNNLKIEAGTGYFKKTWAAEQIKPEMGHIVLENKGDHIIWGGLYWQYFEDLDQIKSNEGPLKIKKEYYIRQWRETGEKLHPLTPQTPIKTGDLVRIRLIIQTDRPMEFVHLKDLHAAGLEPVQSLSGYRWQDGLGYYQSITDTGTHFFIQRLPKGIFVFEYDLSANVAGNFVGGIAKIENMYAPEFSSHSKGQKIKIKPNRSL